MYVQFVSVVLFPAVVFHLIVLCAICRFAAKLLKKKEKKKKGWVIHDYMSMVTITSLHYFASSKGMQKL